MKTIFTQQTKNSFFKKSVLVIIIAFCWMTNVQARWLYTDKTTGHQYTIINSAYPATTGEWSAEFNAVAIGTANLVVPSTIDFMFYTYSGEVSGTAPVVAFMGVGSAQWSGMLESVVLPATIKKMGNRMFEYNRGHYYVQQPGDTIWVGGRLKTFIAPGITEISMRNFVNCPVLTTVNIPAIATIGSEVFKNCTALASISLPETLKTIDNGAFDGCTAMTSFTLPESVEYIGDFNFRGMPITSIRLPKGLKTLSKDVFRGASLETVYYDCEDLMINDAFHKERFPTLKNLYIGSTVRDISTYRAVLVNAFRYSIVENLTIAEGVETMNYAFTDCNNLQTITIPASVVSGKGAFYNCKKLKEVTILGNTIYAEEFSGCAALETFTIPANVARIDTAAFQESGLQTITIPASVEIRGKDVFSSCPNLQEAFIRNNIIQEQQFTSCSNLKKVEMSENVTTIGKEAFSRCGKLEKISIPENVTTIANTAFLWCNLREIIFHSTIIPSSFQNFPVLQKIYISENVTSIEEAAFYNAISLQEITVKWLTPLPLTHWLGQDVRKNVFYGVNTENVILRVPRGTASLYKAAAVWKDFIIEEDIELKSEPSATSAIISWYKIEEATGYTLSVYTDAAHTQLFNSYNLGADGRKSTKLSYTIEGLSPQTTYYYMLTALGQNSASLGEYTGSFVTLEVYDPVSVTGITLNKHELSLNINAEETLVATILPNNATNKTFTWFSCNITIATVNSLGKVTGKAVGETYIIATTEDGSFRDSCKVTINPTTGIAQLEDNEQAVKIYPNPTFGQLKVESGKLRIENIQVFDMVGKLVFETKQTSFNISHLSNGMYFVKVGNVVRKVLKR